MKVYFKNDSIYNVPKTNVLFDDWYTNSVKLQSM